MGNLYLGFKFAGYEKGEVMDDRTIGECLLNIAEKYPDKEAVSDLGVIYTWRQLIILTDLAVKYLKKKGIKRGTHVAIWANNSIRWVILFLALQCIGAVTVLMNEAYKWRELEANLANCDVEYIFYSGRYKDSDHVKTIQKLNLDKMSAFKESFLVSDEVLEMPVGEYKSGYMDEAIECQDVCSILFTSGTTGVAKGVMLTHSNIVNNAKGIIDRLQWNDEDKMCLSVPMYHCFGITVGIMGAVHTGASMHIVRRFNSTAVFEVIEKYRCNIFNGVPTMFLALKNSDKRARYDLTSLQGGLVAGSAILSAEYHEVCKEFSMKRLNTAFGQTESSPAITISEDKDSLDKRADTSGRCMPDVEVRIVKDGKILGNMQEGEIQTRGYHVMKGYYKMPEETKKVLSEDGWLSTGDLGYLDEECYLHITGRIKDIIIRGGENISPAEIEQIICQMPEVSSVKVVGVKAEVILEEVAACIIWKDNNRQVDEEQVKELVRSQLADYKVSRYILGFDEFPMNSSGKILSKELSEICYERIHSKE